MSEAKQSLGQIAKAAFIERLGQSSPILQSDSDEAWEAAADAAIVAHMKEMDEPDDSLLVEMRRRSK